MAKAGNKPSKSPAKKSTVKRTTPVRNSAIPRKAAASSAPAAAPSRDDIARRAYEIYASGQGGTPEENWHRAERELRGV